MRRIVTYILALCCLVSCTEYVLDPDAFFGFVELQGMDAEIADNSETKAAALDPDNYVGRKVFAHGDEMVITTMKRTTSELDEFNYSGLIYNYIVAQGQTAGSWNRNEEEGGTVASPSVVPERVFWSDATNDHTFIGYSLPQQAPEQSFTWNLNAGSYSGELRVTDGVIDHTTADKICQDDLLLTYDTEKVSEPGGSVAKLLFHHALANVRVVVNISGFSASNTSNDTRSVVTDMVLENMLTKYHWNQDSFTVVADDSNVSKNAKLWIPVPAGKGSGSGRTFTFYCLAVPTTMNELTLDFTVSYPNPLNPAEILPHRYSATLDEEIVFSSGYCTTINVSLNHMNEKITVGAEYTDWQFISTPDEGELRKNDTFMSNSFPSFENRQLESLADEYKYTIAGDPTADHRDATWLYIDSNSDVVDIYGNDGSSDHPYVIKTAKQLLSFAYEVSNGNGGSGRSFEGKYVKLDANITMQPTATGSTPVSWIGIGADSKPFDGYFIGGERTVGRLKGNSFFHTIGGRVDQLNITSSGSGNLAVINKGIICACSVSGDLTSSISGTDKFAGGLVDDNQSTGTIVASYHVGKITAGSNIGGIAGQNSGTITACYSSGSQSCGTSCSNGGIAAANTGTISGCFYNMNLLPDLTDPAGVLTRTTSQMQREAFVTELNTQIPDTYSGHAFAYVAASYPKVY